MPRRSPESLITPLSLSITVAAQNLLTKFNNTNYINLLAAGSFHPNHSSGGCQKHQQPSCNGGKTHPGAQNQINMSPIVPQNLSKPWVLVACQGQPIPKVGFLALEAGAWLSTPLGWLNRNPFPRTEVQVVHKKQERDGLG